MYSFCICDDDEDAVASMKELLDRYSKEQKLPMSVQTFSDSTKLAEQLENGYSYEFYLLDILMPLSSGLDLAHLIREHDRKAHILFLTSSPEYALDSFQTAYFNYINELSRKEFPL